MNLRLKAACRRYARAERRLLVNAGAAAHFSHTFGMPPLEWWWVRGMIRWFPLHRCAVSLHHRLISLLPAGSPCRTDLNHVEKADPLIVCPPTYDADLKNQAAWSTSWVWIAGFTISRTNCADSAPAPKT